MTHLATVYDMERYLAVNEISGNDKHDMLDAYKVYFDAYNTWDACEEALETCGLPEEDPEYKKLKDELSEAYKAYDIAWDNYYAIYDRLFR
uniref:Uncharacterized protein n=1 Tax=viral metagenome TaxID=1070528 RepID=A0A6C0JZP4_9ZZZZ